MHVRISLSQIFSQLDFVPNLSATARRTLEVRHDGSTQFRHLVRSAPSGAPPGCCIQVPRSGPVPAAAQPYPRPSGAIDARYAGSRHGAPALECASQVVAVARDRPRRRGAGWSYYHCAGISVCRHQCRCRVAALARPAGGAVFKAENGQARGCAKCFCL